MILARRLTEAALFAVLVVSAVVIAWRILAGPISFPIPIHSPLNAESFCGLAVVLLVLLRAIPNAAPRALPRAFDRADAMALLALTVTVLAAFWRTANFYFVSDDFVLLKYALASVHYLGKTFTTGGGDGFYRPLIEASFAATPQWMGLNTVWWHSIGYVIHAANSILVYVLAWKLGYTRFAAGFAATLFALHATRPEIVVWITGRFDLLSTFFVLLTLVCFAAARDAIGRERVVWMGASLVSMVLGLLCKESAYACPLALVVLFFPWGSRRSTRGIIPFAWFFAAAAMVFAYRWVLLGGIGGYLTAAGRPEASSLNPVLLIKALILRLWAILFFPVNWSITPSLLLGAATVVYLVALIKMSTIRVAWRTLMIPLALLLVLVLPVLQRILIGVDLEKARYLYLPSVAFCLLLATVADRATLAWKWSIAAAVLAFNTIALFHNFTAWREAAEKADAVCGTVARAVNGADSKIAVVGLPRVIDGAYFFANGLPECVALRTGGEPAVQALPAEADTAGFTSVFSWNDESRTVIQSRPYRQR